MLLSAAEFRKLLFRVGYKGRGLLVAFNFPFDISRLALDYQPSQGRFLGGFSFVLFQYRDRNGILRPSAYRPAITIKHMDGKRSFMRFTATIDRDEEDKIPEGAATPKPDDRYIFRGHMLDAKTLAFALTDQGMSLERALRALWRRARQAEGQAAWDRYAKIYRLQPARRARDVRAYGKAARGIRAPSDPASGDQGLLAGFDR